MSGNSVIKDLASTIARQTRHSRDCPTLLAIGHTCIYQAVKVICLSKLPRRFHVIPAINTVLAKCIE